MRMALRSLAQWAASCAICIGFTFPSFADVSYTPGSGNSVALITLSGQIKKDDLKHLIDFILMALKSSGIHMVRLDSIGGDLETALAMGRVLRADKAIVSVLAQGKCFSSCVFVLAGGTTRGVYGPVGIHRPYAPVDNRMTAGAQKQYYERLEKQIRSYLTFMNIPVELYDHMIRIPPEKMKLLTKDELQRYGLSENDPYEAAAFDAGFAKDMGITVQELIQRKAKADSECASAEDSGSCYKRIVIEGK